MAVETKYGSHMMTNIANTVPVQYGSPGGGVKYWRDTVTVNAAATSGSLYYLARLPSNARIHGASKLFWDALGQTTAAWDLGIYNVGNRSDFTDDQDALLDGVAVSTGSSTGTAIVSNHANYGKRLWELVGTTLTADPGGMLDIVAKLTAHNVTDAGDLTIEIYYSDD